MKASERVAIKHGATPWGCVVGVSEGTNPNGEGLPAPAS
jgi:hypothetical protein